MKLLAFLLFGFLFWPPFGRPSELIEVAAQPVKLWLSVEPAQPVNGSPVLFRVWADQPLKSLSGTWLGRRVFFEFDPAGGAWCGFAGVELGTSAGKHQLKLEYFSVSGGRSTYSQTVTVGRASYSTSRLRVAKKFLEPDAETLERIKQEQEVKREVFRRLSGSRWWKGGFAAPVDNIVTEPFGVRRVFNGKRQSTHQGLDFRAALGTPVKAMNSGEVILARDMFFEGGMVVIDHGHGLLTMYLHLSEIKAKEGSRVGKGQVVGLSGATGKVTSEHLHVAVRWQGTYLD
ncbi:MAG: M23 family metallopeptidase, partial [Acidobacteriota bacterium]